MNDHEVAFCKNHGGLILERRRRIHKRMLAYDGMAVHPDIGFYGNDTNREWKQYALPDDNEPEAGVCLFHTRTTL